MFFSNLVTLMLIIWVAAAEVLVVLVKVLLGLLAVQQAPLKVQ